MLECGAFGCAADWFVVQTLLAEQGVYVWCGNHYALPFTETAGLEPAGTIRAGALHYNTPEEIQRLVTALRKMRGADC